MTKKKQKPEPVKELAYWTEDASGVWHFILGGLDGPQVAEIYPDKSRKAPKGLLRARWFKGKKIGGTIFGTDLALLKREVLIGYIKNATLPEIDRLMAAMDNHLAQADNAFDVAAARWREYAERHTSIRICAELELRSRGKQ